MPRCEALKKTCFVLSSTLFLGPPPPSLTPSLSRACPRPPPSAPPSSVHFAFVASPTGKHIGALGRIAVPHRIGLIARFREHVSNQSKFNKLARHRPDASSAASTDSSFDGTAHLAVNWLTRVAVLARHGFDLT